MAHLEVLKGGARRRFDLRSDAITIGRSPDCDLTLESDTVSRAHARVAKSAGAWRLEDLGSRNGTFLNGNRISTPAVLSDGDRIRLHEALLSFHADEPPARATAARLELPVREAPADLAQILTSLEPGRAVEASRPEARLRAVLEIVRTTGTVLDSGALMPKILQSLFHIFPQADRGLILLEDPASGALLPKASKSRIPGDDETIVISRTIVRRAMEQGHAILSADASSDTQFEASRSVVALRIRSVVCAPLVGRSGKPLGVIQLHSEGKTRPFTQEDLDVLASTAHAAALAVENARLHEEHLAQAKIARDLELAREVQRGFLPSEWPRLSGYGFYSYYEPARSVGGDYYGFVALPDERLVIALGDVSGKGVPAALMMARLSSDIRFAALSEPDPAAAVGLVNRSMGESGLSDRFVTLVYMVVDSRSHRLSVVNAGHMPPIVRHADGSIEEIGDPEVGLPLNVSPDPDYRFESAATELEPGSTVLVYTDGVSEAANPGGEMFGMDRVRAVFAGAGGDAVAAGEAVVGAARDFAAGAPQGDDVTVVCFARNPA